MTLAGYILGFPGDTPESIRKDIEILQRELPLDIASWIAFYNDRRLHQALGYRALMAVWREPMRAAKPVDRVDNADALTTSPQQQQQTESLAA